MRRIRIHVDGELAPGVGAGLPEAAVQHLVRVLRLGVGDGVVLFNGDGHDYQVRITSVARRGGEAEVLERVAPAAVESPLRITLAQAVARGEKMDWILQKATELGVAAIVPLQTERTEVRLDPERVERRLAHWRGVVVAACEQCGRATLPVLSPPMALDRFASAAGNDLRLVLEPEAAAGLGALQQSPEAETPTEATLAIGPEGGWSERELELFRVAGWTALALGPRVLRTETAGVAAIAALQAAWGDLA